MIVMVILIYLCRYLVILRSRLTYSFNNKVQNWNLNVCQLCSFFVIFNVSFFLVSTLNRANSQIETTKSIIHYLLVSKMTVSLMSKRLALFTKIHNNILWVRHQRVSPWGKSLTSQGSIEESDVKIFTLQDEAFD